MRAYRIVEAVYAIAGNKNIAPGRLFPGLADTPLAQDDEMEDEDEETLAERYRQFKHVLDAAALQR